VGSESVVGSEELEQPSSKKKRSAIRLQMVGMFFII
jgi:hypothetical protein